MSIKKTRPMLLAAFFGFFLACHQDDSIDDFLSASRKSQSHALWVKHRGRTELADFLGDGNELVELQSITKSITSLVLGILLTEPYSQSLDQPLVSFLPARVPGQSPLDPRMTLRHVLSHTTGISDQSLLPDGVGSAYDSAELALSLRPLAPPGRCFSYSNVSSNILSMVIQNLSGRSLEDFTREHLFKPLGINDYRWHADRSGRTYAMGCLFLRPSDLMKIGEIILHRGRLAAEVIIPEAWIATIEREVFRAPYDTSLFWWGRHPCISSSWLPWCRDRARLLVAEGWMGQYLVVAPDDDLVAVRLHDPAQKKGDVSCAFDDFPQKLVRVFFSKEKRTIKGQQGRQ